MQTDELFRERIKDAAYNVIKAKLDYFKGGNAAPLYPDASSVSHHIPDKEGQLFFLEQACRSITFFKQGEVPLLSENAGSVLLAGSLPKFFEAGRKRYPDCAEFRFSYEPGPNETAWMSENIVKTAAGYDTVIICVSSERSAAIAQALKPLGKKVIVLSIMTPSYSFALDWADSILVGYSYSSYTFEALFGALNGEYSVHGTLPYTAQ